jgi:carboxylesterase type B
MPRKTYDLSKYLFEAGPLGHIEGLTVTHEGSAKIHYFGGLPYALPPVGPYRFRKARQLPPCYRYGHKVSPGNFTGSAAYCPQPREEPDHSLWDENCLQLNLYVPAGRAPNNGWPVLFYIHGGFLQWGNPNEKPTAMTPLMTETALKAIIVAPAYRLNAFGFLVSRELADEAQRNGEPAGNMGFWDQRMALEWTWKNASLFGGNQSSITLAGYSAGSHSVFQQLAHELYFVPDQKAIIKRAIMWSNSPGVQPKRLDEHQAQFDEYIAALGISSSSSAEEKLKQLRALSPAKLVAVQDALKYSEFRAYSDGVFIPVDIIASINSGDFAKRMKARGVTLMNGENRDEHSVYRIWRTPADSYAAVQTRLCADYPASAAEKLMRHYCRGSKSLPKGMEDWQQLFGHIYADMQVHALERGFHDALFRGGLLPGKDVLRYRFDRRMKCMDTLFPPEWGVTHATDMAIWFWGLDYGDGLTSAEEKMLKGWNEEFAAFVRGDDPSWGPTSATQMRRLRSDGQTDVWEDDQWEKGLEVWKLLNGDDSKARL